MSALIIIPTYNEIQNIPILIDRIKELKSSINLEILIIDDGSPDGTSGLAEKLAVANSPRCIHLLKRLKKQGLGPAYVAGFREALELGADQIIQMDADLSHNPNDLPMMVENLKKYDFTETLQ